MTNMKVKCQLYNPNFVREREKKKKHGNSILFGSIKSQFNNFVLKTSLKTCQTQIKAQILTPAPKKKKKKKKKPTYLCMMR